MEDCFKREVFRSKAMFRATCRLAMALHRLSIIFSVNRVNDDLKPCICWFVLFLAQTAKEFFTQARIRGIHWKTSVTQIWKGEV